MKKLYYLVSILLMSFLCTNIKAQVTTALVNGKVTDEKNQPIPGASVVAVNTSNGVRYGTQTNTDGRYVIANMNPGGPYTLTINYIGYKKEVKGDLTLSLGTTSFNFNLKPDATSLSEVVIKSTKKQRGNTNINQDQIKNLPTLSRSLQDLTKVTPQSNNNSFLGTNFRYNNVTLDGAINNDAIGFSPSLGGQTNASGQPGSSTRTSPVSLDAIQDIQVYLAPYDVKIGNFLGGSINAVTRSGTNQITGSVYGFGHSTDFVGANRVGDGAKMPDGFHQYQTGFRVGLPIIKDKLFFFTNEELTRRQDPIILAAGSTDMPLISQAEAQSISDYIQTKYGQYGFTAGAPTNHQIYSRSNKFFNRLDWNINDKNQLSIRNNTITSQATNLERDQLNFRFGSIDFQQVNNQNSTVAELKSRFGGSSSNSLIVGYSSIHDYRNPLSNPAAPQIEIASKGGTIFIGSDREGSIFNMKQKTFEITDNFTFLKGNHTFTIGTHNELYNITYGFVNSWNGRVGYGSISDFLNNIPNRVRTNFNYADNTRDNIMANPPAQFKVNMFSIYGQDEIQIGDKFKLTPGLRFDYADVPNKQPLSAKTINAAVDPNYGTTYTYTQPKDITNKYLGKIQVSPRLGFNYDVNGNQSIILRGGSGLFTGRIPFAWMGYAYYNNGVTYGAFDQKYDKYTDPLTGQTYAVKQKTTPPMKSDPIADALSGNIGEANFAKSNGVNVNDANGATQVDLIDNNFKMPQAWRSNLALEVNTANKWKFSLEGIYTKVIHDLKFQQINLVDNPTYMIYDTQHQQPIYSGAKINPLYTNAYLLSNTDKGYRYNITAQVSKVFPFGLDAMLAYTYGQSKDITNGIRNSMESNWQLNQSLTPNNPGLAYSNFDVRNRIVSTINYHVNYGENNRFSSTFSVFFNTASGLPFSYGFVNSTINGTPQANGLAYIPANGETSKFFASTPAGIAQAADFDAYIDGNKYLSSRRGQFTERNGGRTPWNTQADFRFTQDFHFIKGLHKQSISFTFDIVNLTNMLNKNWGVQYFSPNTFNSTASVGLRQTTAGTPTTYPVYTWSNPGAPYAKDFFASRYQMQFGLRYTF